MTNKTTSCLDCPNHNCFIKKHVPAELLTDVDKNNSCNRIAKKQLIFSEGNDNIGIHFVKSGIVKVFKNGAFNKDQIIRFCLSGDILGHRGLPKPNIFSISSQTITDAEVCFFSRDYFFRLLERVPQLTINLMLFYAEELNYEETKLRDMAIFTVREKVAKAIICFTEIFGLEEEDNEIKHIEKLSRRDMAELVGLTSNQATKILAEFKEENLIEITGKRIKILDKKKIENIISI
ncbi:Crp/Fnr family transcriptional regulator [bacterium]|nr:Crp/Fnr family transcriptional regulator [bacterium]